MSTLVRAGVETYYEDRGGDGPVLVWGHGFLVSSRFFGEVIDQLPGYRSIAVDLRRGGRAGGGAGAAGGPEEHRGGRAVPRRVRAAVAEADPAVAVRHPR